MGIYSQLNRPIVIVAYDPHWPALYEEENARILAAIAPRAARLEHVGSTSIPGLAAKPVIDIAIGIPHLDQAQHYLPTLEGLGYTYMPELEADLPARRFLWWVAPSGLRYHISLSELQSPMWQRPLVFREYLRQHSDAALEYERLKEQLATHIDSDIEAYIHGKTAFVEWVLQAAATSSAQL
jgi:GrpB-like predicted nucleotidyltransferase (UPF0157 family)